MLQCDHIFPSAIFLALFAVSSKALICCFGGSYGSFTSPSSRDILQRSRRRTAAVSLGRRQGPEAELATQREAAQHAVGVARAAMQVATAELVRAAADHPELTHRPP